MSRQEEILSTGREILYNCKKSETVSFDIGVTSVEMHIDKIIPLFQNLLKNWDKECRKDKERDNPLKDDTMKDLYNWIECEMRGYKVAKSITLDDVKRIVSLVIPSRLIEGSVVPYPIEVIEMSVNQGDKYLPFIQGRAVTNMDMRKILSEVYTTIIYYVNEIVSEIDIETMPEGYDAFQQYRHPPVEYETGVSEPAKDSGDDMKKWIMKQGIGRKD